MKTFSSRKVIWSPMFKVSLITLTNYETYDYFLEQWQRITEQKKFPYGETEDENYAIEIQKSFYFWEHIAKELLDNTESPEIARLEILYRLKVPENKTEVSVEQGAKLLKLHSIYS